MMEMTPDLAVNLQLYSRATGDLLTWVVYRGPSDLPDKIVARPHSAKLNQPLMFYLAADDLGSLREMLPPGLAHLNRHDLDDPVIVETWI